MNYFIITGASTGLGEGIALELAVESNHLICISRGKSQKLEILAAAKGCPLTFFHFDLSNTQELQGLAQLIFERIDLKQAAGVYLVNNAGVINPVGPAEDCPPEAVHSHLHINLLAPMLLTSAFIKFTSQLNVKKRVLNISSGAANYPYFGWSSYCTGKAGLNMFTRCVAAEQHRANFPVEIMAVAPGIIDTQMQEQIRNTSQTQFIDRDKFIEYKASGQLIDPLLAGKRIARLLLSNEFKNGAIIDLRDAH